MKKNRHIFAKYIMRPRDPKMTHVKGYMSDPNNKKYDEVVGFSIGLSNKDKRDNHIILDIDSQTVVKNTMSENKDWAQFMNYFLNAYEKQIMNFLKSTGGVTDSPPIDNPNENNDLVSH